MRPHKEENEQIFHSSRSFLALIALTVTAALVCGCATQRPLARLPETPPKLETLEDAEQLLVRNYGYARSIKASGAISLKLYQEQTWRPASIVLMVEKPDKVRLRGYRALTPTLFELISNGEKCWLFVPSENTAYLDPHCGSFQQGKEGVAISADAIVAAIMVISDTQKLFSLPASVSRDDERLKLRFGKENGPRIEIWMDLKTGLVTHQSMFNPDGTIEADIVYTEVSVLDNTAVPVEIIVKLPRLRASMRLHVGEFEVDPKIPAGAFSFSPPRTAQIRTPTPEKLESFFSGKL